MTIPGANLLVPRGSGQASSNNGQWALLKLTRPQYRLGYQTGARLSESGEWSAPCLLSQQNTPGFSLKKGNESNEPEQPFVHNRGFPMSTDSASTPLMRQYHAIKQQVPGALLMFRLGDFYELFFDDAILASRELEITLTARNKEKGIAVPMCGVPYHAAEGYI